MRILIILLFFIIACMPPKALPKRRPENEAIKLNNELTECEESTKELKSKISQLESEKNLAHSENEKLRKQMVLSNKSASDLQKKLRKQIANLKRPVVPKETPTPQAEVQATATPTPESHSEAHEIEKSQTKPAITEYSPSDAP